MLAIEAITDQYGNLQLLGNINLPKSRRVIITILDEEPTAEAFHLSVERPTTPAIDLAARGLNQAEAADLRARLATFHEEWNSPEMDIYDDYDTIKEHV